MNPSGTGRKSYGFDEQPGQNIIRELIGVKDHLESLISSMDEGVFELDAGG